MSYGGSVAKSQVLPDAVGTTVAVTNLARFVTYDIVPAPLRGADLFTGGELRLAVYVSFLYQAGSWRRPRKVVARLECSLQPVAGSTGMRQEVDIRYVVTSLTCHSATANQVRLVLHTAAFWLMHGVRAGIPKASPLAKCEFTTIRERLIKIGARVIEHLARIRVQLPTSCPEGALFRCVALGLMPSGP